MNPPDTRSPPDGAQANASAGLRVLVVDDDESLRRLACHWLVAMGYTAQSAQSAHDALSRLAREPFAVLFTDIAMPGSMDGIALATKARQAHPGLRIVIASAYAAHLLVDHDLPGEFLNKPYTKESLAKAISAATRT